jgi:hypothetical protein
MVVSFVCGLGVFGRIPITTTEATMPLSNCAKNIIRYLLSFLARVVMSKKSSVLIETLICEGTLSVAMLEPQATK